jgi:hypothetical protein
VKGGSIKISLNNRILYRVNGGSRNILLNNRIFVSRQLR